MTVTVKGFPTEVGEYIELPDIAELMVYPYFLDNYIESVHKMAPSFLKYLLDKVPLRNNKRFVTVRSEVKFLHPSSRSCTGVGRSTIPENDPMEGFEWHIDSDISPDLYNQETDVVHLLSSDVKCLSLFNRDEFTIDIDPTTPYNDFIYLLATQHRDKIVPQMVQANRIHTFSNHLHSAVPSPYHELRYLLRVVETDRERPPSYPSDKGNAASRIYDIEKEQWVNSIVKENDQINLTWRKCKCK